MVEWIGGKEQEDAWRMKRRENETKKENYMNCRTHKW